MPELDATYVLPIRCERAPAADELDLYLRRLTQLVEVIVVDGSPAGVFARHAARWGPQVRHVPPDTLTLNGKVGGVMTEVRLARHERVIIADDDVRYSPAALSAVVERLAGAAVVRPQNYFDPLPWHARWDTARSLLNRMLDGDWPGTLGVRRTLLLEAGGYDGDVLFENLELVRTMQAAGGREQVALDIFVRRLPPPARHFGTQRVRQAYDEFARPRRLAAWLAVLPLTTTLIARRRFRALALLAAGTAGLAEAGRRRSGGRQVFPAGTSLLAPAWVLERAVCSWVALGARLFLGGVPYRGCVVARAAHSPAELRTLVAARRAGAGEQRTA